MFKLAEPRNPFRLAILFDPKEKQPPSDLKTLEYFKEYARTFDFEVIIIGPKDFHRLKEFDGLFLRTAGDRGTVPYQFACYALQEGLPVIDDPQSIVCCTDKILMQGLMASRSVPLPKSEIVSSYTNLQVLARRLGLPLVLKLPDSCFSRGVFKVESYGALKELTKALFQRSGLLLAQEFIQTDFDWRIGILDNEPIYACQYDMVNGHWQIIWHSGEGEPVEGDGRTIAIADTPPGVIDVALLAARGVGVGLYGVDLKQVGDSFIAIEVNDNPNLTHGDEDLKDDIWLKIIQWYQRRASPKHVSKAA